jgi:hypothetical protein
MGDTKGNNKKVSHGQGGSELDCRVLVTPAHTGVILLKLTANPRLITPE